jgi:hypothetical protein
VDARGITRKDETKYRRLGLIAHNNISVLRAKSPPKNFWREPA